MSADGAQIAAIRAELERVLQSNCFSRSERLSRFLRYIVTQTLEGRTADLKESVLAVEVFDRHPDHDTHLHSIVRVEAHRLRGRLEKYYDTEGGSDPVRIEIPKGGYVPVFRRMDSEDVDPTEEVRAAEVARSPLPGAEFRRAAAALVLVAGAAAAWLWWHGKQRAGAANFPEAGNRALTRVTADTGLTYQPAISPEAELLAYASDRAGNGNLDIWVQPIEGGRPVRLTDSPADDFDPDFSPDGKTIVFRSDRNGGGIFSMDAAGGATTRLAVGGAGPRFSPDGRQLAYWVGENHYRSAKIFLIDAHGGNPRAFAADFSYAAHPLWSPDGRSILFVGVYGREAEAWDWWLAPANGGRAVKTEARQVLRDAELFGPPLRWGSRRVFPSAWTRDNRIIFSATSGGRTNVWQVGIDPSSGRLQGPPERLTSGAGREDHVAVRGDHVVFSVLSEKSDIWRLEIEGNGKPRGVPVRLTSDAADNRQPHVARDGSTLVWLSDRGGNYDIYARDLRTGAEWALTSTPADEICPKISEDGARVAFGVRSPDSVPLFVTSIRGGQPELACQRCGAPRAWSPKGEMLLLRKPGGGIAGLHLPRGRSPLFEFPTQGEEALYSPDVSPDGRWVVLVSRTPPDRHRLYVVPFRDGAVAGRNEWIEAVHTLGWVDKPRWSADGSMLFFISDHDGFPCIWAQRLDRAAGRPVGLPFKVWHFQGRAESLDNVDGLEMAVARDSLLFSLRRSVGNVWKMRLYIRD